MCGHSATGNDLPGTVHAKVAAQGRIIIVGDVHGCLDEFQVRVAPLDRPLSHSQCSWAGAARCESNAWPSGTGAMCDSILVRGSAGQIFFKFSCAISAGSLQQAPLQTALTSQQAVC